MTPNGYQDKILHVDLARRSSRIETPDDNFFRIYAGGGLLAAYYLLKETAPGIDPLGPENLLIFASSVVAGHPAAGLPRHAVAAKSPLTGGIGEARAEGPWGNALKASGVDAIIFHGRADGPAGLIVEDGVVEFFDATDLWGKTVGAATDALEAKYGAGIGVTAIGPAGENLVRFASVVSHRTFQAARMGMGAVMGSKNLKAVVLRGHHPPPLTHPEAVVALTQSFADGIPGNPLSTWQYDPPGFSVWVHTHGIDAALDVENYRKSEFAAADNYKPEAFMQHYRGAAPCTGCPNDCIKIFHVAGMDDLDPRAGGIHQEITGTLGPNIGANDTRHILRANNLCNQWGLDPASLGFTLSMAMECVDAGLIGKDEVGLDLRFGDSEAALEMVRRIAFREGFGDVLAEGTRRAAARIGKGAERYAMQVKGQEMVPFEPRSQTNLALGYAVAPTGPRYEICEHDWDYDLNVGWPHSMNFSRTLGILNRIPMWHYGPDKVRNFKVLNNLWSAADALLMCIFAVAPTRLLSLRKMAEMVWAVTGWETSDYEIMRWGERRNHLMRVYNNREGLTSADDDLPGRFFDEAVPSGIHAGRKFDRARFREVIQFYYQMMGWDEAGRPLPATLYDHHLEWTLTE
ncbi:MAG: hypothetical protein HY260_06525 [Chloroflexi bacterium]|nr:hypothetical protein [Chloroflexota bacterium]